MVILRCAYCLAWSLRLGMFPTIVRSFRLRSQSSMFVNLFEGAVRNLTPSAQCSRKFRKCFLQISRGHLAVLKRESRGGTSPHQLHRFKTFYQQSPTPLNTQTLKCLLPPSPLLLPLLLPATGNPSSRSFSRHTASQALFPPSPSTPRRFPSLRRSKAPVQTPLLEGARRRGSLRALKASLADFSLPTALLALARPRSLVDLQANVKYQSKSR